jgi:hypothetical protein
MKGRKSFQKSPRQNLKGRKSFQKSRYSKDRKPLYRFRGVTYRAHSSTDARSTTPPRTTPPPTPDSDTSIGYESPMPATEDEETKFKMMSLYNAINENQQENIKLIDDLFEKANYNGEPILFIDFTKHKFNSHIVSHFIDYLKKHNLKEDYDIEKVAIKHNKTNLNDDMQFEDDYKILYTEDFTVITLPK